MILADRISQFIGKALTRARVLQTELIEDFDYRGYLNDNAEKLLLQIGETYDFVDLISSDYKGGLTEKQVRDLIDFFYWWLELDPVIAANYINYQMPIEGNITIPGGGGGGSFATTAQLNAEIANRIKADQALGARIDALEVFDPSTIFPEGFFDNYTGDYSVVFDDDPRLHTHANIAELDQILSTDIANIKALTAHFGSVGTPGGMHVSQEDRDRWDAGGSSGGGSATQAKFQLFTSAGESSFTVTNGVINQVNFVAVNTAVQPPGSYTLVGNDTINFGSPIPVGYKVHIAYFEDLLIVDGGGGGAGVYDLTSPSTIAVGGMPAGTNLAGRTWQSIIEEIAVEYILPAFSSFSISDIPNVVEVGVAITGAHNFTWSTSNSFNVLPNSIAIRDVTANVIIASNLANDGAESVGIGTIPNAAPMTHSWRAEGKNTNNVTFVSGNDSVTSVYPYFYGKVASGGLAPGLGRPTANQALINSGNKVIASSNGTISINFNSLSDDYIWFAIPATSANKNVWFVSLLNNGSIGGPVTPGGNLFPVFDTISVDSPTVLWLGINYKVYVSNYQTAIAALMELRNS